MDAGATWYTLPDRTQHRTTGADQQWNCDAGARWESTARLDIAPDIADYARCVHRAAHTTDTLGLGLGLEELVRRSPTFGISTAGVS